ncbi:MAG TPA: helix-turn-helix transcriptional regulator [Candidatus Izemoplasmatales bacterium]|nr:helix-turn-helix transcriptional regulator [Candidatus Izemoplasmatales bacterium]
MNIYLAEKLKNLRFEKSVSQEKLAQYLNVSFQAVSKWETGNTFPDISLLPDIARFFGITVDDLLCVEKLDEKKLFQEYSAKTSDLHRCGKYEEVLALWQEAFKRMPNSIDVKEMLMSSYFDTDRKKYFNEFVELATEIYNSAAEGQAAPMYYKGQAIAQLARTYSERCDDELAQKWASRSVSIFNSKEIINSLIDKGERLVGDVAFCMYWFLEEMYYMATRVGNDNEIKLGYTYKQDCLITVANIFETVYRNDDMGFEEFQHLLSLHTGIAEFEVSHNNNETVIRDHLERAMECCMKSIAVKAHKLTHPMLYGWWGVLDTPSDKEINLRLMRKTLEKGAYDEYRDSEWFIALENKLSKCLL